MWRSQFSAAYSQMGRFFCALTVLGTLLTCCLSSYAQLSNLPLINDLAGSGWTIKNGNGSITVDAAVPVYALEALYNAKMVPNPLERCATIACSLCTRLLVYDVQDPLSRL